MALPRRRKATAHEMLPHMDASVRFWPVTAVDPRPPNGCSPWWIQPVSATHV